VDTPGPGPVLYVPVAEIEIDAVVPARAGFRLDGRGADGTDYRVELHLDLPLSQQTHRVLGELLSQCEMKISRKPGSSLRRTARLAHASRRASGPA
jgi:hypothetical protein